MPFMIAWIENVYAFLSDSYSFILLSIVIKQWNNRELIKDKQLISLCSAKDFLSTIDFLSIESPWFSIKTVVSDKWHDYWRIIGEKALEFSIFKALIRHWSFEKSKFK